jgi:hypothetical protein
MAQPAEQRGQMRSAHRFRCQSQSAMEQSEIVRQALARAAGETLRRVGGEDDKEHPGEKGAA